MWWQRDGDEKKIPMVNIIKMPTVSIRTIKEIKEPKRTEKLVFLCVNILFIFFFVCVLNLQTANVFSAQSYWEYRNLYRRVVVCMRTLGAAWSLLIFLFLSIVQIHDTDVLIFNNNKLDVCCVRNPYVEKKTDTNIQCYTVVVVVDVDVIVLRHTPQIFEWFIKSK